jgi:hypothetical protein
MTVNANFIPGDESQEYLRGAALQGTLIKNVRLYVADGCDFSAPDQVSAGGGLISGTSGLTVGSFTDPTVDSPGAVWSNSVSFAPAGPFTLFIAHTDPNWDGGDLTIESQATSASGQVEMSLGAGNWTEYGFEAGDVIILDYNTTSSPPRYGKVESIVDPVMVLELDTGDAAAIEDYDGTVSPNPQVAVHGATPAEVAGMDLSC